MDTLQVQIQELEGKINSLHHLVERIGNQVTVLSNGKQPIASAYSLSPAETYQGSEEREPAYSLSNHKDILIEGTSVGNKNSASSEREIAPEIQIRRLTAQLTAAYNRIAALEEQLLTYRIKS